MNKQFGCHRLIFNKNISIVVSVFVKIKIQSWTALLEIPASTLKQILPKFDGGFHMWTTSPLKLPTTGFKFFQKFIH